MTRYFNLADLPNWTTVDGIKPKILSVEAEGNYPIVGQVLPMHYTNGGSGIVIWNKEGANPSPNRSLDLCSPAPQPVSVSYPPAKVYLFLDKGKYLTSGRADASQKLSAIGSALLTPGQWHEEADKFASEKVAAERAAVTAIVPQLGCLQNGSYWCSCSICRSRA